MNTSSHKLLTFALLVAVGVLYFLHFSSKNPSEPTSNDTTPITRSSTNTGQNLKIAYVNSDTVSKHYLFAEKIQTSLLAKRSSAENQIKGKYSSYEKMVTEYQNEAPIMGQREAAEKAQNIGLLEQEIMKLKNIIVKQVDEIKKVDSLKRIIVNLKRQNMEYEKQFERMFSDIKTFDRLIHENKQLRIELEKQTRGDK